MTIIAQYLQNTILFFTLLILEADICIILTMKEEQLFKEILKAFPVLNSYSSAGFEDIMKKFVDFYTNDDNYYNVPEFEPLKNEYLKTIDKRYLKPTDNAIKLLETFCNEHSLYFFCINKDDIISLAKELFSKGLSQGSVRVILSRLRQLYAFLEGKRVVIENPFEDVNLSAIKNAERIQYVIPSEKDIKTIIKNLPIERAVIIAIMSIKGYSLPDIWQLSFSCTEYENLKTNQIIAPVYCWLNEDIWDYLNYYKDPEEWTMKQVAFGDFSGFYEYQNSPVWYNKLLQDFWKEINENYAPEKLLDEDDNFVGYGEPGILFYKNNNFSLHYLENCIIKEIKELYNAGKIEHDYSLKNFRYFAVARKYKKHHDQKQIQKMLKHSTPNTTKQFLEKIGLLSI